jgi:hypothetical protein
MGKSSRSFVVRTILVGTNQKRVGQVIDFSSRAKNSRVDKAKNCESILRESKGSRVDC